MVKSKSKVRKNSPLITVGQRRLSSFRLALVSFLVVGVIVEFTILYLMKPGFSDTSTLVPAGRNLSVEQVQRYAGLVLDRCSQVSYRPSCYDKEVPSLMDMISMEDAFEVTRTVQEKDKSFLYCHVLGHELSALETKKDPDKWKEVVARCPSGICSNGCIHGAFQERFRAESLPDAKIEELKPELEGICETRGGFNPTGLEQASCYHALGHLVMYITGANLDKSTKLCEDIATKDDGRDFSQLCFDGAFMQIFQPLEPEDFALVAGLTPKKEDLQDFCSSYKGKARASCWSESWPLYKDEILTPNGLVKFCSFLENADQTHRCYNAMFYVITPQLFFDEEKIKDFCGALPERQGQCFANAASRMIETDWRNIDKSISLCLAAKDFGVEQTCYEELLLYSTYNFHPGSSEFYNLCNSLPGEWKQKCLNKV